MLLSTLAEEALSAISSGAEGVTAGAGFSPSELDITGGSYSPDAATTVGGSAGSAPPGGGGSEPDQDPDPRKDSNRRSNEEPQDWFDDPDFEDKAQEDNLLWRIADAIGAFFGGPIVTVADMATSAGESTYRGAKTIRDVVEQDKGGMGSLSGSGEHEGNPGTDWKAALDLERRDGPGQW